ncbi:tRNA epoxyqueuosine(34) reductase QueG [Facklamia miroungae]|uniref:Epoxyqueuosine reductase n=1 Tax=Facklamia miroungae TaxID=120956 RepID=A0A1G7QVE1_9LACT|nr:tRNA epoxyqueuosine(34) reductase QueG [Facklamia miroungae]NKZ29080.1 tRNA epoxyqueuosine(34) reductase QueG [Facklamia miroungae]SDG02475.1 epoxyqueuosine reductase [Facklamia miroungae]
MEEFAIDKIGFASAEPFVHFEDSLREQKAKGFTTGFEHPIIEERIYPEKIFEGAQSIISIALAYPSRMDNNLPYNKEERRGSFARASWGEDYHHILSDRMQRIINFIKNEIPDARFKPMVDTGELMDVVVAERAGLGFIGRNGLLVTKEFGSYVYLGEIITNIPFAPDSKVDYGCGDCNRCITACPTQALLGDGRMNAQRCLSYQTQTKGHLAEEFRRKITHVIYGCDICQMTCPYNKGIDFHNHLEMEPNPEHVTPVLKDMLNLSNKEFKKQFGHLAGSWRGKKPLQRNAIIALANYRDQTALTYLLDLIENDPRPVIRASAAYAVSVIQREKNPSMVDLIQQQLQRESDPETIEEMQDAIDRLQSKKNRKSKRS